MREETFPECRWVTVVDAEGRRRLEMRWQVPVGSTAAQLVPTQLAPPPSRFARAA